MASNETELTATDVIFLPSGAGRRYVMGNLTAVFKADEAETNAAYSVSEWILQPGQPGVGPHSHDANDEIFVVLDGCPDILIGQDWRRCNVGDFVRIPCGVMHDFRNLTLSPATLLNIFLPGGFERSMPQIVAWFAKNP